MTRNETRWRGTDTAILLTTLLLFGLVVGGFVWKFGGPEPHAACKPPTKTSALRLAGRAVGLYTQAAVLGHDPAMARRFSVEGLKRPEPFVTVVPPEQLGARGWARIGPDGPEAKAIRPSVVKARVWLFAPDAGFAVYQVRVVKQCATSPWRVGSYVRVQAGNVPRVSPGGQTEVQRSK